MNFVGLEDQVRALLAQGRRVEAIKRVRKTTGWGLKESKDYVDALDKAALPTSSAADETEVEREARALIRQGRPIEAIKRVWELTGWGLRESKDYVDALIRDDPVNWALLAPKVRDLLAQDMKDEAVEWVVAQTEMDVQKARDYVDLMSRPAQSSPRSQDLPAQVVSQVRALLAQDRKIDAIKLVHSLTDGGLRESKDYVESLERGETVVDYRSLSAEELLAELEQAGRTPDLDLIRACLERREELTPGLLEMLAGGVDEDWEPDDPRWYREVHAGLVLIAFREPAALPIFAEIFRDEERENLIEWFDTELPAYGPAATQMAIDLLNDDSAYDYARAAAPEMLSAIALHHPGERERILEALRAQLPPLREDGTLPPGIRFQEIWTWVASALANLRDTVSQPQGVALYKRGLIDEAVMGGLEDYLAEFEPDARPPLAALYEYDVLKTYEGLHQQAARETQWRAKTVQPVLTPSVLQTTGSSQPTQHKQRTHSKRKVGRNDPCPCGSGRKYKHCCGKKR